MYMPVLMYKGLVNVFRNVSGSGDRRPSQGLPIHVLISCGLNMQLKLFLKDVIYVSTISPPL